MLGCLWQLLFLDILKSSTRIAEGRDRTNEVELALKK